MDTFFSVSAVMSLVDNITGPLRGVRGGMAQTEAASSSLGGAIGGLTRKLLPLAVAAGIVLGALAPGISVAADFEQAISGVAAVSQASQAEMLMLEQAALDLGASTAWSASQVAEAEKYLAMAGFRARENIAALPAVLNMASAGATDLARAADIGSDILSAFGLEAREMTRVADVLTATFTTANTDLTMLGETMKYVAPVARAAGMSLEQTSAMAGLLGNIGIKSSQAGTALRAMLAGLAAPSSAAADTMRDLGVSVMDAAGNMRDPIQILAEMSQAMQGMGSGTQLNILETVFGREAMSGAAELIERSGLGDLSKYVEVVANSTGAAAEVAGVQMDNFRGAVTMLGSAFEGLQISIGKIFLPVLTPLVKGITAVVSWMVSLARTDAGQWVIGITGGLAAGIVALTAFSAAGAGLAFVIPMLKTGLVAVAGVVGAISWPVWVAVGAVVAMYVAFKTNFMGIGDVLTAWWNKIRLVSQGVYAVFTSLKNGVGEIRGALAADIRAEGLEGVVTSVSRVLYRVWNAFDAFWGMVKAWASDIPAIFAPLWESMVHAFSPLAPVFQTIASAIAWVANELWGMQAASDVEGWRLYGEVMGSLVGAAFHSVAWAVRIVLVPFQLLIDIAGVLFRVLVFLGEFLGNLAGMIVEKFSQISDFLSGMDWSGLGANLVQTLKTGFLNFTPMGWVLKGLSAAVDMLAGVDWSASGAAIISTLVDGIRAKAMAPVEVVKDIFGKLELFLPGSDAKEGPLSHLTASGRAIMSTLGEGARQAVPELEGAVKAGAAAAAAAMVVAAPPALPVPEVQAAPATATAPVVESPVDVPELPEMGARVSVPDIPDAGPLGLTGSFESMEDLPAMNASVSVGDVDPLDLQARVAMLTLPEVEPISTSLQVAGMDPGVPAIPARAPVVPDPKHERDEIPGLSQGPMFAPGSGEARGAETRITNHRTSSSRKQLVINITHLTLPGVKDSGGFIEDLQEFVEGYDA